MGDNDLLDESFNPDVGVSKHMAKMCENNTTLSANLSFAACCRPFIDLLALKLPAIADPGAVPVSLGNGKRTRAASGDGASANEDATCSPCYKSDSELGDCDGDRRYFFHDSTKLLALRPSVISKNRKLQQKVHLDSPHLCRFCHTYVSHYFSKAVMPLVYKSVNGEFKLPLKAPVMYILW